MEAQDEIVMRNTKLGINGELKFHQRAWTSNWYTNRVDGFVKDADGNEKI